MRAYTTTMSFSKVAVIAQNLKIIFWIPLCFQPTINTCTAKFSIFAMCCSIVVDMVYAQKSPVIDTTASTFTTIRLDNCLAKLSTTTAIYRFRLFRILFSPCFGMRAITLFILIIMLQIICSISRFFSTYSFFGIKLFTHRNILP